MSEDVKRPIRFGVVLPQGWRSDLDPGADPVEQFETMAGVARTADDLGFDSIWLYDHLQPVAGTVETTFECWTSLAAIARETRRVRLGQIVTCNGYRNPALLAKMAATLDAASAGRVILGLGAGWDQREYEAYGFPAPYPPTRERLLRLGEAARVIKAVLGSPRSTVEGEFHSVRDAVNLPIRPRLPLLIGGAGEQVTLRIVARHADACNFTDSIEPGFYRHKLAVLAEHCDRVGRDYRAIERTASFGVSVGAQASPAHASGEPSRLVDTFGSLVEAGIEHFILYFHAPTDLDSLRVFASEVMPAFR